MKLSELRNQLSKHLTLSLFEDELHVYFKEDISLGEVFKTEDFLTELFSFDKGLADFSSLEEYKNPDSAFYKSITRLKCNLPEGWLQERQISTNYMTLRNIIKQRNKHRLNFWEGFIMILKSKLEHPELIEW